eukprot:CAMPEP_0197236516 /NCGR_PEP_ID=MMETSP1429-20130617/3592_1 /TAXON_ID=49237 /ORGANISM="Chaetoceros  sp., Strain UNC1202" /LENGTH=152 /DNA_ID=CAMNT_0042695305 /DNA_START=54 /DNA_END=512 /DNA_ORIENTATION=+
MGDSGAVKPGTTSLQTGGVDLDDPNLSQEEKDLRLALALQQQENTAAYEESKKRQESAAAAKKNRTTRSNFSTSLASIRKQQKEAGDDSPKHASAYTAPGTSSDEQLAHELSKVEQTTAGAAKLMDKIVQNSSDAKVANKLRTGRSTTRTHI